MALATLVCSEENLNIPSSYFLFCHPYVPVVCVMYSSMTPGLCSHLFIVTPVCCHMARYVCCTESSLRQDVNCHERPEHYYGIVALMKRPQETEPWRAGAVKSDVMTSVSCQRKARVQRLMKTACSSAVSLEMFSCTGPLWSHIRAEMISPHYQQHQQWKIDDK